MSKLQYSVVPTKDVGTISNIFLDDSIKRYVLEGEFKESTLPSKLVDNESFLWHELREDNKCVGMICYGIHTIPESHEVRAIFDVGVLADYRGKLPKRLFEKSVKLLKKERPEVTALMSRIHKKNKAALKAYTKIKCKKFHETDNHIFIERQL